jgi:hypothetical protein
MILLKVRMIDEVEDSGLSNWQHERDECPTCIWHRNIQNPLDPLCGQRQHFKVGLIPFGTDQGHLIGWKAFRRLYGLHVGISTLT